MHISMNMGEVIGVHGYDVEKSAELIKNAGFDAVDYDLCPMVDDDCPFNGDNYKEIALEHRRIIEAKGLYVNQTHTPFTFHGWSKKEIYDGIIFPRIVRSIEISALLGARTVIVHPLHYFEYHGREEETFELNMDFYKKLIPYCEKYGVIVCTENMFRRDPRRKYLTYSACAKLKEFIRYVDTLDSKYVRACLDLGHVGLPVQDEEAYDFVRDMGKERIVALHVHDNDYRNDCHAAPYMGDMNWSEIAKSLGEIDYDGVFTYEISRKYIENVDEEFLPVTMKYFADIAKHLCDIIDRNRPKK